MYLTVFTGELIQATMGRNVAGQGACDEGDGGRGWSRAFPCPNEGVRTGLLEGFAWLWRAPDCMVKGLCLSYTYDNAMENEAAAALYRVF